MLFGLQKHSEMSQVLPAVMLWPSWDHPGTRTVPRWLVLSCGTSLCSSAPNPAFGSGQVSSWSVCISSPVKYLLAFEILERGIIGNGEGFIVMIVFLHLCRSRMLPLHQNIARTCPWVTPGFPGWMEAPVLFAYSTVCFWTFLFWAKLKSLGYSLIKLIWKIFFV